MDFSANLIDILLKVLGNGVILIGLVTAMGYALLKKPKRDIVAGFIKSAVGITLLLIGAMTVVGVMLPIGDLTTQALGIEGVTIIGWLYSYLFSLPDIAAAIGLTFVGGFLVNLLIARLTRFKYITLNPDIMMAETIVILPLYMMGLGFNEIVILGSIYLGIFWAVKPALARPFMDKITKNSGMQLGHGGVFAYTLGAAIGGLFGNPNEDVEKMKIPDSIAWLKDIVVSTTLFLVIILVMFVLLAGPEAASAVAGDDVFTWIASQTFTFAAGIVAILTGVRMMTTEIVPSFKGISDKLVPGAMVALDCPIMYPFAPMGLLIGFMFSFVGYAIAVLIFLSIGSPLLPFALIGTIWTFFLGANSGIFGNVTGGYKGAIISSIFQGCTMYLLASLLYPWLGPLAGLGVTLCNDDLLLETMLLTGIAVILQGNSFGFVLFAIPILYFIVTYVLVVQVMAKKMKRIEDNFLVE